MKINIKNAGDFAKAQDVCLEVIEKVLRDNEMFEKVRDHAIRDIDVIFQFDIDGYDEPQSLVHDDREIFNEPELFEVRVELDDEGNIIDYVDNENETFHQTEALLSKEMNYISIDSAYDEDDLELIDSRITGEFIETLYNFKGKEKQLIRYFVMDDEGNAMLVQEMELMPKEEGEQ